jgi:hypothetical protein
MLGRRTKVPSPTGSGEVEGTEVMVEESTERWSEFKLEDGTIVRAKQMLTSCVRLDSEYDQDGRPLYVARGAPIITIVSVPESLQKKEH